MSETATKDHHASLGRFVEAFELMVYQARNSCLEMFRGLAGPQSYPQMYDSLLHIVFYNQFLTAKPLFEIMRAMTAEVLNDDKFREANKLSAEECSTFLGVLTQINSEYADLVGIRNNLLHGTWFIGNLSGYDPSPMPGRSFVLRGAPSKSGWDTWEPKDDLDTLSRRCEIVMHWISAVSECLPFRQTECKITDRFALEGKHWHWIWP
jgi:hypothetical protein